MSRIDASVTWNERLYPVLQRGRQFAGCATELFQQEHAEARVRVLYVDRDDGFLAVVEHMLTPVVLPPGPERRRWARVAITIDGGRRSDQRFRGL
jgi:hypothetical protein